MKRVYVADGTNPLAPKVRRTFALAAAQPTDLVPNRIPKRTLWLQPLADGQKSDGTLKRVHHNVNDDAPLPPLFNQIANLRRLKRNPLLANVPNPLKPQKPLVAQKRPPKPLLHRRRL